MIVTALNNQNQFDLAVQVFGTVEAVFDVAINNDLGITDTLIPGSDLIVEESEDVNEPIQAYYSKNELKPATDRPEIEGQAEIQQGIGFWKIGNGFKVS